MSIFELPPDHWLPLSLAVTWGLSLGLIVAGLRIKRRARRRARAGAARRF